MSLRVHGIPPRFFCNTALDQLFQRRNGHLLTLRAYHEIGGVKGALSKWAEETYAALPSDRHRQLARTLFTRLIDPGLTEQDNTRRRAPLSEFSTKDPTQTELLQETIEAFTDARLLMTNRVAGMTTIEVSHEALIREWTRLAGLLHDAYSPPADHQRGCLRMGATRQAQRTTLSGFPTH